MKESDLKSIKVRPQKLNYHFPKASTIFFKDISSEKLGRNFFARVKMIGT